MADSDWDVDDLKIFLAERRFDLGKEDGVGDMIKDDCDKHEDNCDDDCYDNTSCNVFFIRVFFHRHWRFTGQQGKGGDHLLLHSTTLPIPPAHEHWDIYLQLCMMLVYLVDSRFLSQRFWHGKPVYLKLQGLSPLYYKRTD